MIVLVLHTFSAYYASTVLAILVTYYFNSTAKTGIVAFIWQCTVKPWEWLVRVCGCIGWVII